MWPFSKPKPPPKIEYDWYVFDPKPDITAYELAMLLKHVNVAVGYGRPAYGLVKCEKGFELPPVIRRHFTPKFLVGDAG